MQMTSFQLQLQREAIKREKDKDEVERKKKATREVQADCRKSQVLVFRMLLCLDCAKHDMRHRF